MLPRPHRLRHNRDFELVHRRGRRFSGLHFHLWVLKSKPGPTQVGITTSRKVGNAVCRNRFRRLIRESLRPIISGILDGYKIVVVVRPRPDNAPAIPSLTEVSLEVQKLLGKSGVFVDGPVQQG